MAEIRCGDPQCEFSIQANIKDDLYPIDRRTFPLMDFIEDAEERERVGALLGNHHNDTRPTTIFGGKLDGGHTFYAVLPIASTCNLDLNQALIRVNGGLVTLDLTENLYR